MPTFRNWKTKSGYGIVANLPNAPHPFTYQLKPRAVEFYKKLGYENYDSVDGRLVWPLRKLGDLYIDGEEQSPDDEIRELPTLDDLDKFSFTDSEKHALAQYVRDHPRSTEIIKDNLNERFFNGEFDFTGKDIDIRSKSEGKDSSQGSIEGTYPLPTDVVEHIDNWVNWERREKISLHPLTRTDFLKNTAEVPGAVESVHDFATHPCTIQSFSLSEETLSYRLPLERDTLSDCTCRDHRFNDDNIDFSIDFWLENHPIKESYGTILQRFNIVNGYTFDWEVHSDYGCEVEVESLSPVEWHNVVHDRASILEIIEPFFQEFPEYELKNPRKL
ncbi:hypothetical protein MUK72_05680 [Halococcus dombrowskii]|uniref:Uncharacterized protein n=1 Tax=Halococcus dombrowskii TaxID=179637 RepID=A0AAV3SIA3_HALDO|nr:hypothetical protein [Halococcus dombrowskii]UOO96199.1 hypothetical protein MUK72_05680 [Halococcus dombrowskii]